MAGRVLVGSAKFSVKRPRRSSSGDTDEFEDKLEPLGLELGLLEDEDGEDVDNGDDEKVTMEKMKKLMMINMTEKTMVEILY
ncbi:hypothetical protein AGMMS49921_00840 [Endomicrobiia bacterium]|nr:hypothetical protein AGMMS49921_00840 [Endomicrobiia bacterium]